MHSYADLGRHFRYEPVRIAAAAAGGTPQALLAVLVVILLLLCSQAGLAMDSGSGSTGEGERDLAEPTATDELLIALEIPLTSPHFAETPVAMVEDEAITVDDLLRQIASSHANRSEAETAVKKDYANLLQRVITAKLIVKEARSIGFDELPEIAAQVEEFTTRQLLSLLVEKALEGVEPEEEEVDQLYRRLSRELLVNTVKFASEEDAQSFQARFESEGDFNALAAQFVAEGRGEADLGERKYVKLKDMLPSIAEAAYTMKVGSASSIFTTTGGFLIFYLEDARFYEDPGVRAEADAMLRKPLRKEKSAEYIEALIEKHATIDRKLLDELDFERRTTGMLWFREEAPVDFEALENDTRVLATVHDGNGFVVTVGDLARDLEGRQYHGVENAAENRRLNHRKWPALRDILFRRTGLFEASLLGLDREEAFLAAVEAYESSLLFGTFVQKVIEPRVQIQEAEVRAYYDAHPEDFAFPTMMRLDGLPFYELSDAKAALAKLSRGADFQWVSANSDRLVDSQEEGASLFDNALLSRRALPEDLQGAVEGRKQGDTLLYSSPNGYHFVILIKQVFPSRPQPYEEARTEIARALYEEKVEAAIGSWSQRLNEAYETRIFVTGLSQ